MRKIVMILVCFSILPMAVFAGGYISLGGGAGGEAGALNLTFEFGGISTYNSLIGVGFTSIFNADKIPSGTLGYPCPHNDYTDLGTKQKGPEYGLFVKYGLKIIENPEVFIFVLGGVSLSEKIQLVRSNATGWYYEQSSKTKTNGIFGGGLSFPIKNSFFSIEYDNRRGITGSLGFRW
jgi:hypothetical protein